MQQHKILTWTLLILSIINFAPAAPVTVLERHDVRIDANVTRRVTAAPQKRGSEDEGESPSPNVPAPHYAHPPSPDSTDISSQTPVAEQHTADNSPPPPDNPESSTESRLPVESMPVAGSLSPPPKKLSTNVPGTAHAPLPSLDLTGLSQYQRMRIALGLDAMPQHAPPPHPYSTHWSQTVPPNPGTPSGSRLPVARLPVAGSHSLPPERLSVLDIPGMPNEPLQNMYSMYWSPPRTPQKSSQKSDPLPTPLQSPGADPETHPPVDPKQDPKPLLAEFWDNLLKDKIKRQMSNSDAVTSAQEDSR